MDDFSLREPVLHFGIYVFLEHLLSKKVEMLLLTLSEELMKPSRSFLQLSETTAFVNDLLDTT